MVAEIRKGLPPFTVVPNQVVSVWTAAGMFGARIFAPTIRIRQHLRLDPEVHVTNKPSH